MYLSKEVLQRVFNKLQAIGPDTGKSRQERVSAISRFLACADLLQSLNVSKVSLAPESETRSEFVSAVGRILKLDDNGLFTPDFVHKARHHDYRIGSNFLTTQVKNSRGSNAPYPGRPAHLLQLTDESASLFQDYATNLLSKYNWSKFCDALALWLSRDVEFSDVSTAQKVIEQIDQHLTYRFGSSIAALFKMSVEEYLELTDSISAVFSQHKPELMDLAIDSTESTIQTSSESTHVQEGINLIIYGAPGTGKSHQIQQRFDESRSIRTVFHPDLQNSDFFGCLKPTTVGGKTEYSFVPGPFARALNLALQEPDVSYYLIIEELNRAPAAAVFGELFQLLDRNDDGQSTYAIDFPSLESAHWFQDTNKHSIERLYIPSNLSIIATMNSADQGVYPLDTAFRRRWEQEYLPLDYSKGPDGVLIFSDRLGTPLIITWRSFVECLNNWLIDKLNIAEDRLLGQWFLKANELGGVVPAKILLYLWDDLLRHEGREIVFNTEIIKTYGQLDKTIKMGNTVFSADLLSILEAVSDSYKENRNEENDLVP